MLTPRMQRVTVQFKPLRAGVVAPARAHAGDGAYDLRAAEACVLAPGARALVRCGFALAVPAGYAAYVLPRSGLALRHGVTVLNAPGLIDSPYRGEVGVVLFNSDRDEPFPIAVGDRIAQLQVVPLTEVEFELVAELPRSQRGRGGFGSSGVR
jgi:dUTP pyrophosphatase